jgi:uncharacterized membrane protein YfcA
MDFYFPIADITFNIWLLLGLGVVVGFLSGLLGVGTGILITPILLILGFPSRIAVASQLNASIGANFSGFLSYGQRKDVDFALGIYLIIGGVLGALSEFYILRWLNYTIQTYSAIRIISAIVLIFLGVGMFYNTFRLLLSDNKTYYQVTMKKWMIYIPFHRVFVRSRTEMSVLVPIMVGFLTGILTISLGGGVNVLMIPFLTYLIGRVSPCVSGTSFFVAFITCFVITLLHGIGTAPVDIFLVITLTVSTSIGSKLGVYINQFLPKALIGLLGAAIISLLGVKILVEIIKQQTKRSKLILDNGVVHYLEDLITSMPENISILGKGALYFAHSDVALYSFSCIFISIFIAYIIDKSINFFIYRK